MTSTLIILISAIIILFIIQLFIIKSRYIKCPPGKLLVIYGKVDNPNTDGTKIIKKGSVFVWPVIQDYAFVKLSNFHNRFEKKFQTMDGKEIIVKGDLNYEVSSTEPLSITAGGRLLGREEREIEEIAKDFVDGVLNQFFTSRTAKKIFELEHQVNKQLNANIDSRLQEMGIKLNRGNFFLRKIEK